MAYDPEARQTSNSAMIIGIIALVLVAGAVLAYYATRNNEADQTSTSTTIIRDHPAAAPATNTVVIAPTVVPTPNTIVVPGKTVTRVERHNTTVNRTIDRNVPAPNASSSPSTSTNTTTNINITPPANTGSGTTGNSATGSGTSATNSATGTENSVADNASNTATSNSSTGF